MPLLPPNVSFRPDNQALFALASDPGVGQVLSQSGNTVSLSGSGGSVDIAATTSVSASATKLTAVTYDTGLLETNVAGVLNVGLGSAIGSTRVEGAKIVIQRDLADPQIEFVKGLGVERIKYDGTKLLMGAVGISGEIYDNFGSPGAAGQQLQSSGPGLPFVWGAGSGVGLTAVVAGTNIGVDNTNPIAPVVSVDISADLEMHGFNIVAANPNPLAVQSYDELTLKSDAGVVQITSTANDINLLAAGGIYATAAGSIAITSTDPDRNITTSVGGGTATLALTDNGGVGDVSITTTGIASTINLSTDGTIFLNTQVPDSSISMGANNGTAGLVLTDVGGVGTVDLTTTGGNININSGSKVVVSCSDFEVGPSNQSTNIQSGTSIDLDAASGASHITMNSSGVNITSAESIAITSTDPDRTITTSVGGGSASVTLTDGLGVGVIGLIADTISLDASGDINVSSANGGVYIYTGLLESINVVSGPAGKVSLTADKGDITLDSATGGNIAITRTDPDGIISASVNGGTAALTLTDVSGVGVIDLTTTGAGSSINIASDGNVFFNTGTAEYLSLVAGPSGFVNLGAYNGSISVDSATGGNIAISRIDPDGIITTSVNNGTAALTLTDVSGVGTGALTANQISITAELDGSIAEMKATNGTLINEARVNLDADNATAALSATSASSASFTADGLTGNATINAVNNIAITSGFTDINLTASLGQIYHLGGQRVRTKFQSSAFYNPTVEDYAICMENAGGSAVTLPLIDANNVGKQYLILHNSTAGAVSVQTALGSGQTIFSSTGAASANPRSLPIGHCHTFTALQVSAFPSIVYGWAMI
jgi:hypothetical protein